MNLILLIIALVVYIPISIPSTPGIIMPKALNNELPVQRQYQQLLVAFRATLGHQQNQPEQDKQDKTEVDKNANLFGSLPLPLQTQTEMAFELMADLDQPTSTQEHRALFSPETWHSLRIIDQEPSALGGIAPDMKTIFGKIFLARLLTSPTTDHTLIKSRQKAIRELCKNPQFNSRIVQLCHKIQPLQEQLLGLTSPEHPLYQNGLRIYLHDFFLRGINPKNKNWNRFSKNFADIWYLAGPLSATGFMVKAATNFNKAYKTNELNKKFEIKESTGNTAMLSTILAGILAYYGGVQIPGVFTWIKQRSRAMDYFYEQLLPLKTFFIITHQLKKKLALCPAFKALEKEIDSALSLNDPNIIELRNLLMGRAFKNKINRVLFGGDLILAIDLLKQCRGLILKGIGLLGACDTYSSLALWFNKYKNHESTPLCFAQFSNNSEQPILNITDFWHVLMHNNPTLNSIKLGVSNPNNAVITGIFESGKSALLQSVALNVVCAQSLGLCLCREYIGSIYASINIYANIKDDLANNRSLFKTELYRALQLIDQIKSMPTGSFSFTIADATFTGTEAGAGQAAAYAIARHLGKMHNSIALHATNFLSLAILGKQEPENFQTFYLPTNFNGKAQQTYLLTRGTQTSRLSTSIFSEEKLPIDIINSMERHLMQQEV